MPIVDNFVALCCGKVNQTYDTRQRHFNVIRTVWENEQTGQEYCGARKIFEIDCNCKIRFVGKIEVLISLWKSVWKLWKRWGKIDF